MNKILCIALSCLVLAACATPKSGSVSTIPWEERSEIDGMSQEYGWGEDDYMYDGMPTPEQPL